MLTQERLKELLDYDPETGIFTRRVNQRGGTKAGQEAGSRKRHKNGKTYIHLSVDNRHYLAHRLTFLWVEGSFPENLTDHEDGDGTNNRWSNLRKVSQQQNQRNQKRHSNNTSGTSGVAFDNKAKKWQVSIRFNGRRVYLGMFVSKDDAISARKAAELEHNYHPNHGSDRPL